MLVFLSIEQRRATGALHAREKDGLNDG